ncbi:MAG: crosslink repair DNA glycosylase YcaQ family protein, partial [Acidobacteriota bacterium]
GPGPEDAAGLRARLDALVEAAVRIYAPLPARTLSNLVRRLRSAAPQWHGELTGALQRARASLAQARVEGVDWYWPAGERPSRGAPPEAVRLLTPFDPVVHHRDRFELLWGWVYRFEAYTPAPKRKLGYYALPLLWRDRVIGWGNLSAENGRLESDIGYVQARPRDAAFGRELDAELHRMRVFLGLKP